MGLVERLLADAGVVVCWDLGRWRAEGYGERAYGPTVTAAVAALGEKLR